MLQQATWSSPPDRIPVRPGVLGLGAEPAAPGGHRTLVTMGTVVQDEDLIEAVVRSLLDGGHEVLLVGAPTFDRLHSDRLESVGFRPLADVLPEADVVVSAGGAGTALAALAHGLPMVLLPVLADQPWNAERVHDLGAGIVIDQPARTSPAANQVRADESYSIAARNIAGEIRTMPSPAEALDQLTARLPACGGRRSVGEGH